MKANFHCAHLHNLSPQGTGDVPTALSIVFTTPSVPLVGDRNGAQTASLYGWRTIRGLRQQRSCSFLCGDEPQGHTMPDACSMLMEPQGHTNRCLMLIARNLLGLLLMGTQGPMLDAVMIILFIRLWKGSTLERFPSGLWRKSCDHHWHLMNGHNDRDYHL